jgi:hypothetical protein
VRERRWEGKGSEDEYDANNICIYANAKMIPAETVPGIRGERWRRALEGGIQV